MRLHRFRFVAAMTLAAAAFATSARAVPIMDGSKDAEYGAALSVQNTNTQFGNADNGDPVASFGSEIDQVFARVANGRLYVLIAGNLERNFNKMEIFLDTKAGGVNSIDGAQLPAAVDPFCCGGFGTTDGALQRQQGLTFDANFNADYYLTFSHGPESTGVPETADRVNFWALTAHYAELGEGTAGDVVAAGMQLAPRGLPNVLRGPLPPDFDSNFDVDGADFLTWQRNLGLTPAEKATGDANDDDVVNGTDLAEWKDRFGDPRTLADFPFVPFVGGPSANSLLGPTLPSLTQGQLIDKAYVTAQGATLVDAREMEFALPVDPSDPTNAFNHRDLLNTVQLEMAFDNSNTAGVSGAAPYIDPTTEDPTVVMTGLEFSIPLSQIGNPTGPIKLFTFINGTGHDYASNQFSGTGILDANLGGDGFGLFTGDLAGVNMNDYAGDQFVTVPNPAVAAAGAVPEPVGFAMAMFAALVAAVGARRRR